MIRIMIDEEIYSPVLTSEGSKIRRIYKVAIEMEIRIITANILLVNHCTPIT